MNCGLQFDEKNHVPISNNLKQEINFWTASSKCNLPCTGKQCSSPAVCIFWRYISCANNTLLHITIITYMIITTALYFKNCIVKVMPMGCIHVSILGVYKYLE